MQTEQQMTHSITKPGQPQFVLTDLLKMASPQGVLLNLKNPQEVMHSFQSVVTQTESILDFQHVRLLQGGIEVDLFVMSSLATELFTNNHQGQSNPPQLAQSNEMVSVQAAPGGEIIQKAINYIFQYKRFRKDTVLADSPLQNLVVVKKARQAWIDEQELQVDMLSEHDKANLLRNFFIKCLDDALSANPGHTPQKKLSEASQEIRDEWIQYSILRKQYVDGLSREQVEKRVLEKRECWITGGTYTRHLKTARKRLATLIWQKEIQARKRRS